MSNAVIQLDGVRKEFGDFVAVEEANFSIDQGEFFAMLGPSGCGKTTTLKMIAGFEQPTRGRVLLEGEDVSRVPPYKRNVNTVFQQYALFPHMTVIDNVRFGPRSKKISKSTYEASVAQMLEVVRLTDFANRKPTQLSGGQQRARRARPPRWSTSRAHCCSTSPSPRSTSNSARRCSSNSSASSAKSASRSCSSRTTRVRPSR